MKSIVSITLLLTTISFFLPFALAGHESSEAVRDFDGDILRAGVDYYILPVLRGPGGGLTLGSNRNGTLCPLDVVQEPLGVDRGLPVTFTPADPKKGVIRVGADQNIQFSAFTICIQPTLWRLDSRDEATGLYFVGTGGTAGNPGRETLSNWFSIERNGDNYVIVFCPTVCDTCRPVCGDVGLYVDGEGVRRLALRQERPFRVFFRKASTVEMS